MDYFPLPVNPLQTPAEHPEDTFLQGRLSQAYMYFFYYYYYYYFLSFKAAIMATLLTRYC